MKIIDKSRFIAGRSRGMGWRLAAAVLAHGDYVAAAADPKCHQPRFARPLPAQPTTYMLCGMCFDGRIVRCHGDDGRWLHFSNIRATGHVAHLERHYEQVPQMGLTLFRNTLLWDEARCGPDYRWLDRLAAVSQGQIELALNHYGLPEWLDEAAFWGESAAAAMRELAGEVARRYQGAFRNYNLGAGLGIWTDWIAAPNNRQWSFGNRDWWAVYRQTIAITIAIAQGLKAADSTFRTAMSKPWGWGNIPWPDQAQPFAIILGRPDEVADQHNCPTWRQGHAGLLDIVGLNSYFDNDIPAMLAAACAFFPDQHVVVAETGNLLWPDCHPPARWWAKFEALGEPLLEVSWSPGLTMLTYELGERMHGNLLSEDGTQHWHKL